MKMPIVEVYCGVGVHDFQPRDRIERIVKPALDRVIATGDAEVLWRIVLDPISPPEARVFAASKIRAINEAQATAHARRLGGERMLDALLAGLDSLFWMDPMRFASLLDASELAPLRPAEQARQLAAAQGEFR